MLIILLQLSADESDCQSYGPALITSCRANVAVPDTCTLLPSRTADSGKSCAVVCV